LKQRSTFAIEALDLVKVFGEIRAVDGVDLAVRTGSVYGGQVGWVLVPSWALIAVFAPLTMRRYGEKPRTTTPRR
jgi:hypothetical protein